MPPFLPEPARTVCFLGDVHIGSNPPTRYTKAHDELVRSGPAVAATVQIGDVTEDAFTGQVTEANTWLDSLPQPAYAILGNHDRTTPKTPDDFAADYGYGPEYTIDLGFCKLVTARYELNVTGVATFLETELANATKPVIVAIHYPMDGVIGAGTAPHDGLTGTGIYALTPTNTATLKDILNRYPIAKAYVNGHTHSWYDAPGFFASVNCGSRNIAHINTSALSYVGGGMSVYSDPLQAFYVTLPADFPNRVEVRVRSLGAGAWMTDRTTVFDL